MKNEQKIMIDVLNEPEKCAYWSRKWLSQEQAARNAMRNTVTNKAFDVALSNIASDAVDHLFETLDNDNHPIDRSQFVAYQLVPNSDEILSMFILYSVEDDTQLVVEYMSVAAQGVWLHHHESWRPAREPIDNLFVNSLRWLKRRFPQANKVYLEAVSWGSVNVVNRLWGTNWRPNSETRSLDFHDI